MKKGTTGASPTGSGSNPNVGKTPAGGVTNAPSPTVFPRKNTESEIAKLNRLPLDEITQRPNMTPPDVMPHGVDAGDLKQGVDEYPASPHPAAK